MRNLLLRFLSDNRSTTSLAHKFRRSRGRIFEQFLGSFEGTINILDLGGEENFWIQSNLSSIPNIQVTLLNVRKEPTTLNNFSSIAGDARDLSQFKDQSFDVVFSNSVIEHVGDLTRQTQMAQEIVRVGRAYFVQTPNRYFPIEPHFLFPFFWHLPESVRVFLAIRIGLGWYPRQPNANTAREFLRNFTLLSEPQFRRLFPSAEIQKERFLGLTKSFIASYLPR